MLISWVLRFLAYKNASVLPRWPNSSFAIFDFQKPIFPSEKTKLGHYLLRGSGIKNFAKDSPVAGVY
jgi:hypothetical protein